MLEKISNQKDYIYLLVVAFLFLITANSLTLLDYIYTYGIIFGCICATLFIAYAFLFLIRGKSDKYSKVFEIIFVLSILNFAATMLIATPISGIVLSYNVAILYTLIVGTIFIFTITMPLFLGTHLIRQRKVVLAGILLLVVVLALILIFFFSGIIIKYYVINDEFFISMRGIKYLFQGINPYVNSLSSQIYYNRTSVGWTLTTNNQIIGVMNYPALYMLSYLPFYFLAKPTIYNMEHYMAPLQGAVLLTLLLFTIAFCMDRKYLKSPVYGIIIFLGFFFLNITSITMYLMLALMIFAYVKTGTKYSWLFFGLCLSIQELLWVPIAMLLLYTINNYGLKKGARDIFGAIVVFLIINSYFIAIGPLAFIKGIFNPIEKLILPIGSSPLFGFLILSNYHILLTSFTELFAIVSLIMAILYIYFNKKNLLAIFAMVPLFFLSRPLIAYYAFFVALLFITLLISENKKGQKATLTGYLQKNKTIFALILIVLIVALAAIIYSSHVSYEKGFDIKIYNQSLYYDNSSNETIYTATLSYANASVGDAYMLFVGYGSGQSEIIGLFNDSIGLLNSSVKCQSNDIECLLNVNEIPLQNGSGTYYIRADLVHGNLTSGVEAGRLLVYNSAYAYFSDSVYSKSIFKK